MQHVGDTCALLLTELEGEQEQRLGAAASPVITPSL